MFESAFLSAFVPFPNFDPAVWEPGEEPIFLVPLNGVDIGPIDNLSELEGVGL